MPQTRLPAAALALFMTGLPAPAADISVTVTGVTDPGGAIGCGLHSSAQSFPMGQTDAQSAWVKPQGSRATCRFTGLPPGQYAIAVVHDLNGNRRVDTNAIGLPTEAWGVSGNIRPALRAPRFAEAAITLGSDPVSITVEVK